METKIEIEGKFYEQITQKSSTNGVSRKMLGMLAMAGVMHNLSFGGSNYSRQRPSVNIIEEFRLIQQKKSKLSRSDRDWVIRQFNRNFREI